MNGKIVLVGIDFADEDRRATPFFTLFNGPKWTTAGVEVHANTIRTILDRRYLVPVATWVRVFTLLLATALAVWIITGLAAWRAALCMLVEVAAVLVATHLLFEEGFILSTSEILLATSICLIGSVIYRFSTEEKATQSVPSRRLAVCRQAVGQFARRDRGYRALRQARGGHHPVHRHPRIHGVQRRGLRKTRTRRGGAVAQRVHGHDGGNHRHVSTVTRTNLSATAFWRFSATMIWAR